MATLECSTKGDTRYSAVCAKINGISIENRYQLSKRFFHNGCIVHPSSFKEAKHWQYKNEYYLLDFVVDGVPYSLEYMSMYYKALWYVYLIKNPELITNANKFDEFTDCYKKPNTLNCQADIIELVVNKGIEELKRQCELFINLIR